jgi:hypothetical protein
VLISLGKRQIDKAVDAPWKYTVEVSDGRHRAGGYAGKGSIWRLEVIRGGGCMGSSRPSWARKSLWVLFGDGRPRSDHSCARNWGRAEYSDWLQRLLQEGGTVNMDALSTLSPYRTEHINRFGNYVIDFNRNAGTVGIAPGSFFIATLGVIGQSVCFLILTGVQGYIVGSVTRLLEGIQLPAFGLSWTIA